MIPAMIAKAPKISRSPKDLFGLDINRIIASPRYHNSSSPPNVIPLNPNPLNVKSVGRRKTPAAGSYTLRAETRRDNALGWPKVVFLSFLWLVIAHVLVADMMWVSFPMYALYTLPPLVAALFLRRHYVLPLALTAFLLAAGSIVAHHEHSDLTQSLLRLGSVAGILVLGVALAKAPPLLGGLAAGKRQGAALRAVNHVPATEDHGIDLAEGDPVHRPLTLERRKKRNLPRDAEAQMQELELLTRRLIQIQEQQQQTVSRELHDNVAQVLTAVTNRLALARTTSARIPAWLQHELFDLQEHLGSALDDIRTLAREMRPSLLDHCGFAAALEKQTQGVRTRTSIQLHLEIDADAVAPFDNENLTHLFRLAQEALQNIEEHSRASRAWLHLGRKNGEMHLEIGDNGCAFTAKRVTEAQADGHLGLLGMRERAELLGGSFLLESSPGTGTVIRVSGPVPPPAKIERKTHL